MKNVLAFSLGVNHPSSRMRIAAYAPHLEKSGWRLRIHHFDSGIGQSSLPKTKWFGRTGHRLRRGWRTLQASSALHKLGPHQPIVISRELPVSKRPFLNAPNPLILDVDDAIYLGGDRTGFEALCRRADVIICGNQSIADAISSVTRKHVIIPTAVDTDCYSVRENHRLNGPLRIGWLGSSMSIEHTLAPMAKVFHELQQELKFELVVISDRPASFMKDSRWVRYLNWSPTLERTISMHIDVGIMPLENNPYQAAKCGAKLLQYMAAGLPVIATPVGVNRQIVVDGVNGYWATGPEEWRLAIRRLTEDESLRSSYGNAGRRHVIENYSIAHWAGHWVTMLNQVTNSVG
ncbi:MAG TPA: glycosyltransferase family 4 protein [Phycisphaerae bacterium]|nr:glycosyltransferase family 4 protein [Phycisphaerae bacterium]